MKLSPSEITFTKSSIRCLPNLLSNNIPDYRGLFLRGLGGNSAENFAITQIDAIRNITGSWGSTDFHNNPGGGAVVQTGHGAQGGCEDWYKYSTLADLGTPLFLISGNGFAFGRWCILSVNETNTVFMKDGTARKIEFSIKLQKYGEDNVQGSS